MAEYIDRDKALADLKESADHHAQDSREEQLLLRDRNIIREQQSVDVVERSKIDKAIEAIEIAKKAQVKIALGCTDLQEREKYFHAERSFALVLEILKRNIGE